MSSNNSDILKTLKAIESGGTGGGAANADGDAFTAGTSEGTGAMGVYESSPTTVSNNDLGVIGIDANRNVKTTHATLNAGEDLTNDVQKVEQRNTPFNITLNATLTIIKSTSGYLDNVMIGMQSNPTITIFDNASGASGTILFHADSNQRDSYLPHVLFTNGATAWVTGGNTTRIIGGYR